MLDSKQNKKTFFWIFKRSFDIILSILILPLVILVTIFLFFLNKYYNQGSIFFKQYRMGKDCKKICIIKFRSMVEEDHILRGFNDPIEVGRVTPLGKFLRKYSIDELPQVINVLKGEMSLIGPRPDYYEHAVIFSNKISNYRSRHSIRPGISGLSQIRLGYAEGLEATKSKVKIDHYYIRNAGFILDLKILFWTIETILKSYK